jgi:2-amino-4-hydroxy-6-hydroxymethyldihydropteridine diphosphokinase
LRAYLALGSNLGDRLATLQHAVDALGAVPGIAVTGSSRVWETAPVGGPEQGAFLNAVVELETRLDPFDLLAAASEVETGLGRTREIRWGPRTIDIDILLMDGRTVDEPTLCVPHPRMHERAFVLMPLLELLPDPVLPDGTRLLDVRLPPADVRPYAPPLRLHR